MTRGNYNINTLTFGTDGKEETRAYNVPSIKRDEILSENMEFLVISIEGSRRREEEGR